MKAAQTKKRAAQVMGGTATTAVVAGVFTFGDDTMVCLSATAVGAAAAGVGKGGAKAAIPAK